MTIRLAAAVLAATIATTLAAQEPPPPPPAPTPTPVSTPQPAPQPPPQPAPQPAPQPTAEPAPQPQPPPPPEPPSILSRAASGAYDRHDALPYVNIYLPEGQASIRLRKLIKNVLFESQIEYKFVSGDIATYLRYKYYAHTYTYKIGVFDTIGFGAIGQGTRDFERVRGGLLLLTFPRDYNHRWFGLLQDDQLTFGNVNHVDNRKSNIYTKIAFQYGTEFDERLNAIVGESRGRLVPVLTAFRELGPQKFSVALAVTESAKVASGDYNYTKLETEAIRRWDVSPTSFVVTRGHLGTFLTKGTRDATAIPLQRYTIPLYEMFRLGGPDAMRSVSNKNDLGTGIDEVHVTNEYFVPIFRNRDFRTWALHWNTLYGIGYAGAGNVGFQYRDVARVRDFAADAGLGAEAALSIRDFNVLLGVLYSRTLHGPSDLRGTKVRVSIRTVR